MKKVTLILLALATLLILPAEAEPRLLEVSELHTLAVGYAGEESDIHKSFRTVLELGDEAKPIFRRALKTGTPAAKLYGAIGLYRLDPKEGREALQVLSRSKEKVSVMQGCLVFEETVGEVAEQLLSAKPDSYSLSSF